MAGKFVSNKYETINSIANFIAGKEFPRHPANIFMEVSNVCNLKCIMCGPFSLINPYRNISISQERRGVIDSLDSITGLEEILAHALMVQCFGYGEPTIYKDFGKIIELLGNYEVLISFFTNGLNLTDRLIDTIINNNVHEIVVSFSGAEKESYESVYCGGNWENVLSNIQKISELKKKTGRNYPRIAINSLAYKHHIERLDSFVEIMGSAGVNIIYVKPVVNVPSVPALLDHISIYRPWIEGEIINNAKKTANNYGIFLDCQLYTQVAAMDEEHYKKLREQKLAEYQIKDRDMPKIPVEKLKDLPIEYVNIEGISSAIEHEDKPISAKGVYCIEPFKTLYLKTNHDVKPCCNSVVRNNHLGNATNENALKIWNGSKYDALRQGALIGRYPSMCRGCIENANNYKDHGFDELIVQYGTWYTNVFKTDFNCRSLNDITSSNSDVFNRHKPFFKRAINYFKTL